MIFIWFVPAGTPTDKGREILHFLNIILPGFYLVINKIYSYVVCSRNTGGEEKGYLNNPSIKKATLFQNGFFKILIYQVKISLLLLQRLTRRAFFILRINRRYTIKTCRADIQFFFICNC